MPTFYYKAVSKGGKTQEGELKVPGREEVIAYLERNDLLLIALEEKKERAVSRGRTLLGGGMSLVDRYIFFNNLSLMITSGLSGFEAVQVLHADAKKESLKKITANVQFMLEQGKPLSEGFAAFPQHFSPVVLNLLKAGEASGMLDKTTKLIATQYKKENDVLKRIKSAMIYPAILMIGSTLIVFMLLTFVVPRLAKIFEESDVPLHPITKITLALSHALSNPLFDLLFFGCIAGLFLFLFRAKIGRDSLFFIFSRLPFVKGVYRDLNLYRFCWTLGALIGSGVGILEVMQVTSDVLTGTSYKRGGERIKKNIEQGSALGQALQKEQTLFPALVASMAVVGEKTGNFEGIFLRLGDFFEENFNSGLQNLIALVEPLLLVAMGVLVGGIAISVILPIYTLVTGVT